MLKNIFLILFVCASALAVSKKVINSDVKVTGGTASTSSTTGALVVTGGLGVSGSANVGGRLAVASASTDTAFNIGSTAGASLTGTTQYGVSVFPSFVATAATTEATVFLATPQSDNSGGTVSRVHGFYVGTAVKGGTDTWTRLINYRGVTPTAGTNNAFMADNVAFTGNWFINQTGTAASLLGGALTIGGNTTGDSNLGTISSVSNSSYYVGTASVTFIGAFSSGQAKSITYNKNGRSITLSIPATSTTCNSAATINNVGTELPSGLRPLAATKVAVNGVFDNSGADINSAMEISTAGVITVYATAAGGNFTASGSCGWDRAIPVTYISNN